MTAPTPAVPDVLTWLERAHGAQFHILAAPDCTQCRLVAALRAVLALCDEMDGTYLFPGLADTDAIRRRITAALDPAHDDERQDRQ